MDESKRAGSNFIVDLTKGKIGHVVDLKWCRDTSLVSLDFLLMKDESTGVERKLAYWQNSVKLETINDELLFAHFWDASSLRFNESHRRRGDFGKS